MYDAVPSNVPATVPAEVRVGEIVGLAPASHGSRESAWRQPLGQILALDQLHRKEVVRGGLVDAVDPGDLGRAAGSG